MADQMTVPSREDPVARGASTLIGGPVGRHARFGGSFWTPVRVLVALTLLTFGVGFLQKAPCRTHAWSEQYQYTRMCYSDVYALYFAEGLNEGKTPYVDHPVEYPVVIGGLMYVAARPADWLVDSDGNREAGTPDRDEGLFRGNEPAAFFDLTALLLAISAIVVTMTSVVLAGRRRPWDAAMVALAPGLLIHGTTNWDLAAVALAGLGLAFWARRWPLLAGLLFGFGTATKLYPVLFFIPLLALCFRAKQLRAWLVAAGGAVLGWLPYNLLAYAVGNRFIFDPETGEAIQVPTGGEHAWWRFWRLNKERTADWDSLWYAFQHWTGKTLAVGRLNLLVAIAFLVALGLILLLILTAPRRPRLGQVLFLTMAAFLLTNKVNSPQYTLWLIPLAVMARPRWGPFLAWQAAEGLLLFTRFYYFIHIANSAEGLPARWFITAVVIRDVALVVIMVLVVREIMRPDLDVVRTGGVDDPAGGVLDDTPDRMDLGPAWERNERVPPPDLRPSPA